MASKSKISRRIDALYIGKSTFLKVFLLGGVAVVSAIFIWYTFDVIGQLQTDTRTQAEKYVRLWQLAANSPTSGEELPFVFEEIILKATLPIIVLDANRTPIQWRNIPDLDLTDTTTVTRAQLKKIADRMTAQGNQFPLHFGQGYVNYFCYGDPPVIDQLRMMPFVEIGIVVAFMLVGIIGFQNIRKSEERHIWVGMAKETAHQLGTPITSMMGWLEVMRSECGVDTSSVDSSLLGDTIENISADVDRLQKVANRFGQIGSAPDLVLNDLNKLAEDTLEYYRRRLPYEGEGVKLVLNAGDLPSINFNAELLGWVLENLVKNALQAVEARSGRVELTTRLTTSGDEVVIEVTDNGAGIAPPAARKIFRAGFTTKKRGWGLGLTLVKRIVEEYHGGKISLTKSKPGETTFEICLPLNSETKT
ncbi:MAG: HAMP domain-containing histidine kinase [candidate division Zixibacteria bacterium]|nr:HAMP domain-containing histidine kinase [candidate division Zixibacteria bacterium]MDH3938581.1 HAMP domain-containing histidine kinase [candidate division Zixibacteria bacterium]MDH4033690.1 HAMP domain-containing histidine kinase [candidate division Zixibacteria bacterium]